MDRAATVSDVPASALSPFEAMNDFTAEVKAALAAAGSGALGMTFSNALKATYNKARAKAALINRSAGGRAAGEFLSEFTDRVLALLLEAAARRVEIAPDATSLALLAMGSYGRRELALYSDIDLLILLGPALPPEKLEPFVGELLRPLWDAGLHVGHAVRTPEECISAMEDAAAGTNAVETATSVLEARFVTGDKELGESFFNREIPQFFKRRGRAFVDAKFEETIARWKDVPVYRTQPNLKESPGALRDFQLALWIDRASQISGHLPRLDTRPLVSASGIDDARAGYEKLLTFRVSLHSLCGRKQDVLDYQMQQAIAEDLSYDSGDDLRASERLLRDYFKAATAVHRLAQTVTRRYLEERAVASRDIERLRRRPIDHDFTRVGGYLYTSHAGVFAGDGWIEAAMRAFLHIARNTLSLSQDVAEQIRSRLPSMTDEIRSSSDAAFHFLTLLGMRVNVGRTLRAMRDTGLLAAYLPEFAEIEGLVIHDTYHDFSVDEHTNCVVEAMDRLYQSIETNDQFRRRILETLARPHVLRLACLFHDLGKSRGNAGHSERGALMVPRIGERLGLSASQIRTLIFLVQEHLTLSKVSQRRDPGEGGLLTELAKRIETKERLDLLFLLTYCDSISVGHASYPHWKDALLSELYTGIVQRLPAAMAPENGAAVEPAPSDREDGTKLVATESGRLLPAVAEDTGTLESRLLDWAPDENTRTLVLEHCHRVPQRYLVEVSFEDAVFHLETLRRMRAGNMEAAAAVRGSGELVDMWVVSTDRPKRFSQVCGALLGAGVSVISAIAYTREDGVIFDHFRVAPGLEAPSSRSDFWGRVERTVEDTLQGKGDFLAKIEAARRRIPRSPAISRRVEPEIRVDNKLSERFTVVDVICGDRIGLLYGLSRALADLSCNIHFAKIATNQGLVTDVFYITETSGEQVTDPEKMMNIKRLLKAVAADFQEARR
jgi:[protein-PII] uridylyltransferase